MIEFLKYIIQWIKFDILNRHCEFISKRQNRKMDGLSKNCMFLNKAFGTLLWEHQIDKKRKVGEEISSTETAEFYQKRFLQGNIK